MIRKQTKILEMDCPYKCGYLEIQARKMHEKTLSGMRGFITMNKAELIS